MERKNISWRITLAATSLTTNPPLCKKRKINQNLKIVILSLSLKFLSIQRLLFINFKKSNIFHFFYTCILEKESAYYTGSAFTRHYDVHRVFFVPNKIHLNVECHSKLDNLFECRNTDNIWREYLYFRFFM